MHRCLPKTRTWNEQALRAAVSESTSVRQVLQKLGLKQAGGNYMSIKKAINKYCIDSSHFRGRGWNNGLTHIRTGPQRPISDFLDKGVPIQSYKLKHKILTEKLLPRRCAGCGLKRWRGKPIPLELEHKDGDSTNNSLENLELLCPNCHAQTDTYRGLNIGRAA